MTMPSAAPLLATGKVKSLGVLRRERDPAQPQLATINEGRALAGVQFEQWNGLFAPPGTPPRSSAGLSMPCRRRSQRGVPHRAVEGRRRHAERHRPGKLRARDRRRRGFLPPHRRRAQARMSGTSRSVKETPCHASTKPSIRSSRNSSTTRRCSSSPRRPAQGRVNLSPKGMDTVPRARPEPRELPGPDRQRQRDRRPCAGERPHHLHVHSASAVSP